MRHSGTMWVMDKPTTRRDLVGMTARLIVDQRESVAAAMERTSIHRSNLYRIFDGDPTISDFLLRRFERGYDLPPFLFGHVLDGDIEWIGTCEIDAGVKKFIVDELNDIATAEKAPSETAGAERPTRRSKRGA